MGVFLSHAKIGCRPLRSDGRSAHKPTFFSQTFGGGGREELGGLGWDARWAGSPQDLGTVQ